MRKNENRGPVDRDGRPFIHKLGTIELDLTEVNPVVFKGRLYRFEYIRGNETTNPYYANELGKPYFRFVDHATGETTPPFAIGYSFGCAFIENDIAYVTGIKRDTRQGGGHTVEMFVSSDLENWEQYNVLDLPGFSIKNTSLCKADDQYALMYEIDLPFEEAGVPHTGRFATSPDLKSWTVTGPECVFTKDYPSAPHCFRYLDGWYYDFFMETLGEKPIRNWVMSLARSKDLVNWQLCPLNPVIKPCDEDRKIANPKLTEAQKERIRTATNINSSDIDFCEFNGQLIINYMWGDQVGTEHIAEAVYKGTMKQFLKGWFPEE